MGDGGGSIGEEVIRMSDYTSDESEKIYNLIDQLPTQYFGGDGSEWEDAVLRLAAIVTARRQRSTPTSKWFRFLPGVHTVIDGKPVSPNGVRVEMSAQRALALMADISRQLADSNEIIEAVFVGQLAEDNEANE